MTGPPREAGPRRIAGYELEGILGRGGTSRVFVARHAKLERRVALKLFEVREGTPANAVPRLLREAKLLARLDHENVVRCFDFGEQDGRVFLVLELVDGRSLKQRLDEEGPLAEEEAIRIALGVARALEHAHAHGIVHRDVKPGNVLLDPEGRVKLTDFGLAKTGEGLDLTLPGTMIGTPQYLSPEQARSPKQADERSDLYSLGATLYHMLTGRPPHVGESLTAVISDILFSPIVPPERVRPGISTAASRVVARLLARQRGLRTRTAAEAIADLERAAEPEAGADLPGLSWEEAGHEAHPRRRPWRVVGGAAAGAVVLALLLALLRSEDDPGDGAPAPPVSTARPDQPFDPADLADGRVSPLEAWTALAALPEGPPGPRLRAAVEREATERARLLGVRASSVARREVAAGRLETALDAFDAEVARGAASALGASRDRLPEPLVEALDAGTAEARRTVADDLVGRAARRANDEIEIDLDRLSGELLGLVTARRYAEGLARVDRELEAADERVAELFAVAVRSVVPESRNARPSPEWRNRAAESYRAALSRLKRLRLERAVDEARESALRAVAAFRVPEGEAPGRKEIERGLRGAVEEVLGLDPSELPGEPGPLGDAIGARVERLDLEVRERERSARRRLEASV
ncbi:MAG: protein kinase, partial [Planctomycetota bacterium JB042]